MNLYSADIKQNLRHLFHLDMLSLLIQGLLLLCGVLFIRHAGMDFGGAYPTRWIRQILWIGVGLVLYFSCALADYRALGRYSWVLYIGGLVLLSLVFFSAGNSRSVIALPGWTFQASEPMKVGALLFCAWILSQPILKYASIPPFFFWGIIIALPTLVIILQHDWGTALVFFPFSYAILFLNGMKKRWIFYTLLILLLSIPLAYQFMAKRQKQRLIVFFKAPADTLIMHYERRIPHAVHAHLPDIRMYFDAFFNGLNAPDAEEDEQANSKKQNVIEWDDWNARQAVNSVGSGGLAGVGYGRGIQHTLGFLPRPVAPTDFIFAVIAEETGFIGTCTLVVLFALLILTTCRTAFNCNSPFGASIALGAAVLYTTHIFINIGMSIEIVPIIGIPLPFVSYGGSCIVTMMILAGIVQSVHIHTEPLSIDDDYAS